MLFWVWFWIIPTAAFGGMSIIAWSCKSPLLVLERSALSEKVQAHSIDKEIVGDILVGDILVVCLGNMHEVIEMEWSLDAHSLGLNIWGNLEDR